MYEMIPVRGHQMVLVLQALMQANYQLSPHVHFDNVCDPKRMKVLGAIAGELFDGQLAIKEAFREFKFVLDTGAGRTPFLYLARLYGSLQKRIKEFAILLKKHKGQPEVAGYYSNLSSDLLTVSIYDVMKLDFEVMEPVFAARRQYDIDRFPHWTQWEPLEIDLKAANAAFKSAK